MATYGEVKAGLNEFSTAHLHFLQNECLRNIEEGILVHAESDLLAHVNAELERREAGE